MTADAHDRARRLILAALAEEVEAADSRWLEAHRADCPACDAWAVGLGDALRDLRLTEVTADPWLLQATRRRLNVRARALEEARASWALAGATAVAFVAALLTVWAAWRMLGQYTGLSLPVTLATLMLLWLLPAGLGGLAVAVLRPRSAEEVRR